MASINDQPQNLNFLSPLGYKFILSKIPNFVYFVQSVDFPITKLNETKGIQTPFSRITVPGDHLSYTNLSVTFKIDEDMKGYFEIFDWITAIGKPDNFDQYKGIAAQSRTSGLGTLVDANLLVLSSAMQPNIKITFQDLLPISISGPKFDSTQTDVNYVTATAVFKFNQITYERL